MKRKVLLLILFIIIIGLIIYIFYYQKENNLKSFDKRNSFEGNSISLGHVSDIEDDKIIISNYSDFSNYCLKYNKLGKLDNLIEKYNKEFFKTQSLAILFVRLGSGSVHTIFREATRKENNVVIEYSVSKIPEGSLGLTVMSGDLIVVEIDKDIDNIISNYVSE